MLYAALLIVAIVIGFVILVARRPDGYRIQRETVIGSSPRDVHGILINLRRWDEWSPWEKKDPNMKKTLSDPSEGLGAYYAWSGNKEVGEGRMTIIGVTADEKVLLTLEFIKPFVSTCTIEFSTQHHKDGCRVVWAMTGKNNFVAKIFCLFMDMDKMIGKDFEEGLASLKALAEK
ncbi:polyketide cyclase [bacterium]|nr:polyketide cyclase [bacterium]